MAATGFLLGIGWTVKLAKKEGVDPQKVYDTCFWIIVSAIVGARIVYILVNLDHFINSPMDVVKLWQGGLVFYGGLIGAAAGVVVCTRKYGLDLWQFADLAAPGLALGHAVGRIGCLFAGCCWGAQTDVPWAITFHNAASLAPTGIPLHPTQIYSSLNEFSLFILLTLIRPWRSFRGQIFLTWLALYSIGRGVIEAFRGDTPRGMWLDGTLSTSQIISVLTFTAAIYLLFRNRKKYQIGKHADHAK